MTTEVKLQGDTLHDELSKRIKDTNHAGVRAKCFAELIDILAGSVFSKLNDESKTRYPRVALNLRDDNIHTRLFFDEVIALVVAHTLDMGVVTDIAVFPASRFRGAQFMRRVKRFYDDIADKKSKCVHHNEHTLILSNDSRLRCYYGVSHARGISGKLVIALDPLEQETLSKIVYPLLAIEHSVAWIGVANEDLSHQLAIANPREWIKWEM